MENFTWRTRIDDASHCSLLQFLVYSEAVHATGNPATAQQSHKKSAFCIALPEAIGEHLGCRDVITRVISEENLIPNIIVD